MSDLKGRHKLIKAFRYSGLYKTIGSDERKIFPKIHSVRTTDHSTEYVFSLPNGLDPNILKKNFYAFRQVFGEQIKLNGEIKKFVFTVYENSLSSTLNYNVEDIKKLVSAYRLGIVCGKDRTGEYIAFDLLKQPHILIAGETGSGKSTQLRSILTTLILTKRPVELQLYLGDCKKSEFHIFRKVEHVQCVLSMGSR